MPSTVFGERSGDTSGTEGISAGIYPGRERGRVIIPAQVDAILRRRVGLGLGLKALLPEFSLSARLMASLEDLLENPRLAVGGPEFSARVSLHAVGARLVLAKLLEEALSVRRRLGTRRFLFRTSRSDSF